MSDPDLLDFVTKTANEAAEAIKGRIGVGAVIVLVNKDVGENSYSSAAWRGSQNESRGLLAWGNNALKCFFPPLDANNLSGT